MMIEKWDVAVPCKFLLKNVTVRQEVSVSGSCNTAFVNVEVRSYVSVNFGHEVKSSKITGIPSSGSGENTCHVFGCDNPT
jgi:hypothetical protein